MVYEVYYSAKEGSPHVVEVINRYREMLRGETLENTAHTCQVLAQRQALTDERFIADKSYSPFTMEEELFEETYIMYGTKGT